jgi:hypothetical protein
VPASGAAMLPYTVIKEANRPGMCGTATVYGVALSIVLTLLLKETGAAVRRPVPVLASTS